jgi:hypothetical protein
MPSTIPASKFSSNNQNISTYSQHQQQKFDSQNSLRSLRGYATNSTLNNSNIHSDSYSSSRSGVTNINSYSDNGYDNYHVNNKLQVNSQDISQPTLSSSSVANAPSGSGTSVRSLASLVSSGGVSQLTGKRGNVNPPSSTPFATSITDSQLKSFDELEIQLTSFMKEKTSLSEELER